MSDRIDRMRAERGDLRAFLEELMELCMKYNATISAGGSDGKRIVFQVADEAYAISYPSMTFKDLGWVRCINVSPQSEE